MTSVSSTTINAEAAMTFDGSVLSLAGAGAQIILGDSHNGGNGGIKNNSGGITIGDINDSDQGAPIKFVTFTNTLLQINEDSINVREHMDFTDNKKVILGTGSDFNIYHSGTHSYLDNNTGGLYVTSPTLYFGADNTHGNDIYIYSENSAKYVQWDASAGQMKFFDNTKLIFGTNAAEEASDFQLYSDGTNAILNLSTGYFSITGNNVFIGSGTKLYFDGGSDTYISHTSADSLDFHVGGTTLMELNEQGGNLDYGQLNAPLFIISDDSSGTTSPPTLRLQNMHSSMTTNDVVGRIDFKAAGDDDTSAGDGIVGRIENQVRGTFSSNDTPTSLIFKVGDNNTGDLVEAMRLLWTSANPAYGALFAGPVQLPDGDADYPALQFGSQNDGMFHHSDGVKIMINNANEVLFENGGDFHSDGDVIAFSTTISDERVKTDVETIDSALDKVLQMRGVEYTWTRGKRKGKKDIGVIAQEIEKVLPEIVREKDMLLWKDKDDEVLDKYKTVDYEKLSAVLIEGMKEQQKQIEDLQKQMKEMKNGSNK
tara:strand:+ start:16 stop:1635 length:1620 start_codon:yes stop_codon:yes gene_type:complete